MRRRWQPLSPLRHHAINLSPNGISSDSPFCPPLGDERTDFAVAGCTGQGPVQRKMRRFRSNARGHDRLKVGPGLESFHSQAVQWIGPVLGLDRQTLAALARRALITARPPRVFMRTKKPWVRARRVLEGWYVRFIVVPI